METITRELMDKIIHKGFGTLIVGKFLYIAIDSNTAKRIDKTNSDIFTNSEIVRVENPL